MTNDDKKRGKIAGIPYDFRRPTKARLLSRIWNPTGQFIAPRWWGWGYDFNFYAVVHPKKWRDNRRNSKKWS